jgi:hypothetical protein
MRQTAQDRADAYVRQVDQVFLARMGVAYSFLRGDLESNDVGPRLEDAVHHDLPPAEFAARVRNQFGLREVGADDIIPINRRIAVLAAFAAENPEWVVGRSGSVYRDGPNGVERLSPSRDIKGTSFGFSAAVSSRAILEERDGEAFVDGNGFIPVAGGMDVGSAVEELEKTYGSSLSM